MFFEWALRRLVGLNSVPAWTQPFSTLSTGERFRANLARRLQLAAKAAANGVSSHARLILDDFGAHLDFATAKCCASSLSHCLRQHPEIQALIATSFSVLAMWLQPSTVLHIQQDRVQVVHNPTALAGPRVRIFVPQQTIFPPTAASVSAPSGSGHVAAPLSNSPASVLWDLEHCKSRDSFTLSECYNGLNALRSQRYASPTLRSSHPILEEKDDMKEGEDLEVTLRLNSESGNESKAEKDGTETCDLRTLRAVVTKDDHTKLCDAYFDTAFSGFSEFVLPQFPSKQELGEFAIGVITGPSGTAKSLLMQQHIGNSWTVSWHPQAPVASHFADAQLASERLSAVRLPISCWYRPYSSLSAGERSMADIARMLESGVVIDEFTSLWDRTCAQDVAQSIFAYIRRRGLRDCVFVSCYHDFLGPLATPDWAFDAKSGTCRWFNADVTIATQATALPSCPPDLSPPQVDLWLLPCNPEVWALFRNHHYKTQQLSSQATSYILLGPAHLHTNSNSMRADPEGWVPVGFIATISQMTNQYFTVEPGEELPRRAHRTVVLPCYQGLGIGSRLSDAAGEINKLQGRKYLGQTVHPRFGEYRDKSPLWSPTQWNHDIQHYRLGDWKARKRGERFVLETPKKLFSHQYVGASPSTQHYLEARVVICP